MQSLWMILASFLFACMGVCVKLAADAFSPAELVFYRSAFFLLMTLAMIRVRRQSIVTVHWRFQLWRSLSGFVSLMLYFYAIALLPLATAATLSYTSPLFLALYLCGFGKAPWRAGTLLSMAIGFAGVVLLLNPVWQANQLWPGLIGLGCGVIAGLAYYNVRELGERGEPEERTVFYFALLCTVGSGVWATSTGFHAIDRSNGLLLIGIGLFGTVAQLAMTRAYKRGNTLVSASLAYSAVIFASLFGMLFWQEALSPGAWSGIALIIVSGLASTWFSRTSASGRK